MQKSVVQCANTGERFDLNPAGTEEVMRIKLLCYLMRAPVPIADGRSVIAEKRITCSRKGRRPTACPFCDQERSLRARGHRPSATAKYTSGATTTMLVILISNDSEIAVAAKKNDQDSSCSRPGALKIQPDDRILKRQGQCGMNERPAKIFSGVKQ